MSHPLVTAKNARQNFNRFLKASKKIRSKQQGQCAPREFAHPGEEAAFLHPLVEVALKPGACQR